jgi:hypothetical protein
MMSTAWRTFLASYAEGFTLLRRSGVRYVPWIVGSAVFAIPLLLTPANATSDQLAAPTLVMCGGFFLVAFVLSFFALADAAGTIQPAFRMTPIRLAMTAVLYVLTWLATNIAGCIFYIPAFYVGVKLSLCVPYYLLGSDEQQLEPALRSAWNATTGVYWESLAVIALCGLSYFVALVVASMPLSFSIPSLHPMALAAVPIAVAVTVYAITCAFVVWLRWAVALQSRSPVTPVAATQQMS